MAKRVILALCSIALGACATAPSPKNAPVLPRPQAAVNEVRELNAAIEDALGRSIARAETPVLRTPIADADATRSMDVPDHRAIRGALDYFSNGLRDKIQASLHRSARYLPMIDRVLREHDLPHGLAYLPVIESAFHPTLTSRVGAHGLWQFMPDTAREYGLRVDWWVDERADPERSTRAAAKFLGDLHRKFGDWSLALAAYNCGPGRVRRTLTTAGASSFWELSDASLLPKETRGYVPTFWATLLIASDPSAYGFELREEEEVSPERVSIAGPVSLEYIAEVAGMDYDSVKSMNLAYRRGVIPPGVYDVRLPKKAAVLVADRTSSLRYEDPYLQVATYTPSKSESVTQLARRLSVSQDDLMAMNSLSRTSLRAGEPIFVPLRQTELSTRLHRASTEPAARYYTVRKGDTLYSIARNHGLSVDELRDLNRLSATHTLRPGERVRVTTGNTVTAGM